MYRRCKQDVNKKVNWRNKNKKLIGQRVRKQ